MSYPLPNSGAPEELGWPQGSPNPNPHYPPETSGGRGHHGASEESHSSSEVSGIHSNSDDLLSAIPNLFRLLDLVDEPGFSGIVEKIVIDQHSLRRLLNTVQPGSYESVSKINFRALDEVANSVLFYYAHSMLVAQLSIKPVGVYGTRSEIIKFLRQAHYLDTNSTTLLSQTNSPDNSSPVLRSGLYLALDPSHQDQGTSNAAYIIYWPEETTWDDQAASLSVRQNRVLFMRYLSKLADQTISLVSSSQARAFVWETSAQHPGTPGDQQDDNGARFLEFEVTEFLEQDENVVARSGFTAVVESRLLPQGHDRENSQIRLVPGENKTALLVARNETEQTEVKRFEDNISPMYLKKMIESKDCPLQLGNLSPIHLEALAAHGLRNQHRNVFAKHDARVRELNAERSRMEGADKKHIEERALRDRPKIREEIQHLVRITYDKLYPSLKLGSDASHTPEVTALLYQNYPGLSRVADEVVKKHKPDVVSFQSLKGKWGLVKEYLEGNSSLSDAEHEGSIQDIMDGSNPQADAEPQSQPLSGRFNSLRWSKSSYVPKAGKCPDGTFTMCIQTGSIHARSTTIRFPDPEFVSQLQRMVKAYPALSGFMRKTYAALGRNLEALEEKVIAGQLDRVVSMERQRQNTAASGARDHGYREGLRREFEGVLQELREAMASSARRMRHVDWIRSTQAGQSHGYHSSANAQYRWGGRITSLRPAQNRHSIYPLELTEQDRHLCHADVAHVPQPKVDTRHKFEFTLLRGRSVEFMQLIRDKCLVAVSERGKTRIFIEDNVTIHHAVNTTHGKVSLNHDSLGGSQCKFAFDQLNEIFKFSTRRT
ncbi:unnamed protein product [Rhizoctonia solani]|uniref:Uncharacterized protein n=1 Tax=Rhizoctonia solani TaxID=456999 RepID=A0A8H3GCA8_9AGAM|nr:unnamed protein product [Rhizoctonia solani]